MKQVLLKKILENEKLILRICSTFYRNKADQDDLLQEIVIRVLVNYKSFKGTAKFSTWLYRIAINTAITFKKKSNNKINLTDNETTFITNESEITIPGERDIDLLYKAIDQLNKIEKAIILLYLESNSYMEIAEIMGISIKNVSVKIVRIKKKLKQIILSLQ